MSTREKAAGAANEAIGRLKQGIGEAVGSADLEADGTAQRAKGDAQQAITKAEEALNVVAVKVADAINKTL